jgi:hypothetical protein
VFACAFLLRAQESETVEQLAESIRSELALKQHTDKQIAAYVKRVHLTEQLPAKVIEDLEAQGAGPKTVEALKALRQQTESLKAPTHDATYSPETAPEAETPSQPAAPHIVHSAPIPPPDSVKQAEILDAITNYARNYTANLPNFVCVEVMRQYGMTQKMDDFRTIGTVYAKVSRHEGQDFYQVYSQNGQYKETSIEKIAGPYSRGDFGTMMSQIFAPDVDAHLTWARWATLRTRRMAVFSYEMDVTHSGFSISDEVRTVRAGSEGLVYADPNTGEIYRVTQNGIQIPADFSVRDTNEILDYDDVEIEQQRYLLPTSARVIMTSDRGKVKLALEFRAYRKFGTQSDITYGDVVDAEKAAPMPETQEQPASAPAQPAKPTASSNNPLGLPTPPPPPPQ